MHQMKSEIRDGMKIDWDAPIAMDDGVELRADVFRPITEGKYPVILSYGPYAKGLAFQEGYKSAWLRLTKAFPDFAEGSSNKYQNWELFDPEKWVPDGYVLVRVDSRGNLIMLELGTGFAFVGRCTSSSGDQGGHHPRQALSAELARRSLAECPNVSAMMQELLNFSGRGQLPLGQGMLIRPTWSVHTAFMRFAIDVIFLDAELTVLKVARHLRPWRLAARFRAHSVLELPAGECERLRIGVGDRLAWGSLEPGR